MVTGLKLVAEVVRLLTILRTSKRTARPIPAPSLEPKTGHLPVLEDKLGQSLITLVLVHHLPKQNLTTLLMEFAKVRAGVPLFQAGRKLAADTFQHLFCHSSLEGLVSISDEVVVVVRFDRLQRSEEHTS